MKRKTIDGAEYALFYGARARVYAEKVTDGRRRWLVCVKTGGDWRARKYKRFAFDELRGANAYARRAEAEGQAAGELGLLTAEERMLILTFRRLAAAEREAGRGVPAAAEMMQAAFRAHEDRTRAGTFGATLEEFLQGAQNTMQATRFKAVFYVLTRFRAAVGKDDMPLSEFTPAGLRETFDLMVGDIALSTRKIYAALIVQFFNFAVKAGRLDRNPAVLMAETLGKDQRAHDVAFLSIPECKLVLNACLTARPRKRALAFGVLVRMLTGIRAAEFLRLTWGDFRLAEDAPYIHLSAAKSKTGKQRLVYLQGTHARLIRRMIPDYAPPGEKVLNLSYSAFTCGGNQFLQAAGASAPTNVLRHTAATYLVAHFGEVGKAALILGHAEAICRKHYLGVTPKAEADKFFRLLPAAEREENQPAREMKKRRRA